MTRRSWHAAASLAVAVTIAFAVGACKDNAAPAPAASTTSNPLSTSPDSLREGQWIFRFETFGGERFWTNFLRLHQVVQRIVTPGSALKVGLKIDSDALPPGTLDRADFSTAATTVALLKLNAIVGLKANVDEKNRIVSFGITCALCHSTVDNSVKPGIGRRLDGWANRDLNVGAIIALSPALTLEQKAVYNSWGPGKYDPRYNLDGKNTPVVIPPAYGLSGVENVTYTGDGNISYWNTYVAVTQMGGLGTFAEPRLGIDVKQATDRVSSKLEALKLYQHSLQVPPPPDGTFDSAMAERGSEVFQKACASCHVTGTGTDNNTKGKLHTPAETGMDGRYAERSASKGYRTTPLRGLWQHAPYFHDGSAATLADVVARYDKVRALRLTAAQKSNLVEYLKSR